MIIMMIINETKRECFVRMRMIKHPNNQKQKNNGNQSIPKSISTFMNHQHCYYYYYYCHSIPLSPIIKRKI